MSAELYWHLGEYEPLHVSQPRYPLPEVLAPVLLPFWAGWGLHQSQVAVTLQLQIAENHSDQSVYVALALE